MAAYTDNPPAFRLQVVLGGVQKSGTTTLFRYLQEHPQLMAPSRKETHFFDNEAIGWENPDYGLLKAFFPATAPGRLAFDATPIYLFWPPSLARIRAHNPDAKLMFLFRDPIERAWSHWRMETHRNAESLPFESAIREGRRRLGGGDPLHPAWRVFSYVERGFYARQLRRLFSLFPREQLLLLSFSDLKHDRHAVLRSIAAFLEIAPFPSLPAYHERRTDTPPMSREDILYLRNIFRKEIDEFSQLSGICVKNWLTMRGD